MALRHLHAVRSPARRGNLMTDLHDQTQIAAVVVTTSRLVSRPLREHAALQLAAVLTALAHHERTALRAALLSPRHFRGRTTKHEGTA